MARSFFTMLVSTLAIVLNGAPSSAQNAYITNDASNTVSVIDTATNTVAGSPIPVGLNPLGVAVTPDGSKVYVANFGLNTVSVIETATNTVAGSPIPVGNNPFAFGIFIQPPNANAGKDACKNGGWQNFTSPPGPFKNQGQCVSFFARHTRSG
jgi:YVTN family beta-propeller protein